MGFWNGAIAVIALQVIALLIMLMGSSVVAYGDVGNFQLLSCGMVISFMVLIVAIFTNK